MAYLIVLSNYIIAASFNGLLLVEDCMNLKSFGVSELGMNYCMGPRDYGLGMLPKLL